MANVARYCCCGGVYIYVVGQTGSGASVWKYNQDLTLLWDYDTGSNAARVDVDAAGNVYVLHAKNGSDEIVTKLNSAGVRQWGYADAGATIFLDNGIAAASDGTVRFTTSSGNNGSLTAAGALDWNGGQRGGVAVDGDGNAYFGIPSNTSLSAIDILYKYNSSGTFVKVANMPFVNNAAGASVKYRSGVVFMSGGASGNGAFPPSSSVNLTWDTDLNFAGGQGSTRARPVNQARGEFTWGTGNEIYNYDDTIRNHPTAFSVSNDTGNPCVGLGATSLAYYAIAEERNDGHDGATIGQDRNLFKVNASGTLLASADVPANTLLRDMIVRTAG